MPWLQTLTSTVKASPGRTAAGVCYRLWSEATRLAPATPPEMHRESLVPLVLGAAGAGVAVRALPFLDPPKEHALAQAESELRALGALDDSGVTDTGRALSGLPIDAALGNVDYYEVVGFAHHKASAAV